MWHFDDDLAGSLRATFEQTVLSWPDVTAGPAFECPAYFVGGAPFATLVTDGVVLSGLSAADRERLHRDFETSPVTAEPSGDWVEVAIADGHALESLWPFVRSSYDAARDDQ